MSSEWSELLEQLSSDRLKSSLRESKYNRLWQWYGEESGMNSNEFKEFCLWARRQLNVKRERGNSPAPQPVAVVETSYAHETGLL